MSLDELEDTLPSGLHDAGLERLAVDRMARTLTLEVRVDMSSPERPDEPWR